MTDREKIVYVQTLVSNDAEATDALVKVYLSFAKDAIVRWKYPCGHAQDIDPYDSADDFVCCQLAARFFLRRGAESESVHIENGVHRHYASSTDADLLAQITPYAKVAR